MADKAVMNICTTRHRLTRPYNIYIHDNYLQVSKEVHKHHKVGIGPRHTHMYTKLYQIKTATPGQVQCSNANTEWGNLLMRTVTLSIKTCWHETLCPHAKGRQYE